MVALCVGLSKPDKNPIEAIGDDEKNGERNATAPVEPFGNVLRSHALPHFGRTPFGGSGDFIQFRHDD